VAQAGASLAELPRATRQTRRLAICKPRTRPSMSLLREAQRCIANQLAYKDLNAFIRVADESLVARAAQLADSNSTDRPLEGKLIAVKDNICTSDLPTTAASALLKDFVSPFDASVVSKLKDSGAVIAGKTNLDEFGMGSHSIFSHFGAVKQQHLGSEEAVSAGGSSGGSALAVATGQCWAALGTDTGGSVRLPAAYTGTVGFKPSYGQISRWGVIAYANSLDTVGVIGRETQTVRSVFSKFRLPCRSSGTVLI
jgi:aspartyl-tRNA(Asn)/glutamyl-tRNA(Gln) amidotransferase subunit A